MQWSDGSGLQSDAFQAKTHFTIEVNFPNINNIDNTYWDCVLIKLIIKKSDRLNKSVIVSNMVKYLYLHYNHSFNFGSGYAHKIAGAVKEILQLRNVFGFVKCEVS